MKERTADRNWVTSACRFVYGVLRDSKRLIGEATQPQGAGKTAERRDARINTEEGVDDTKLDRERHAALKVELCRGLVAQIVVRHAHPPLRPDGAGRVLGSPRDGAAPFRDRHGVAEVAESCEKYVQTDEKAKLARRILERFRQRKPALVFGANLIAVTHGEHRRQCQGFLKNHLVSGASAGRVESGQRPFTPTPAFPE